MSITAERLRELVHYDPETGLFTQVAVRKGWKAGRIIGRRMSRCGYIRIGIDMNRYLAHRLAWLYMTGEWPPDQIDHVNGDRADNRWSNLREATSAQNGQNSRPRNGKFNLKGVAKSLDHWRAKPFSARIKAHGKVHYLGRFATPEEAHAAYVAGAYKYHGQFARTK